MDYNEINQRLEDIKIEDFIWVIYIGIIILSYISNVYEKDYFINNNNDSKKKYKEILIFIFIVLILVYIYFFKDSIDEIKELKPTDSDNKKCLTYLSAFGSLLILISGIIFLYIAINDEDVDVEIAFN